MLPNQGWKHNPHLIFFIYFFWILHPFARQYAGRRLSLNFFSLMNKHHSGINYSSVKLKFCTNTRHHTLNWLSKGRCASPPPNGELRMYGVLLFRSYTP